MATTPTSLKAGDAAINILKARMSAADAKPEVKALAKKRIARYKQMNSTLESNAVSEWRALLRAGHKEEAYKLAVKIKDRSVSYADLGMREPSKLKQGMQDLEEKFGGENLVSTVKGAMAIAILDVLGADVLAKSAVTGLIESGALANLLPTLITFATANPLAAVCLVAVAYLGVKKLFGPIVKKMQAKMELNAELDGVDLENADETLTSNKSLDEFISEYENEHPKTKKTPKKDKGDDDGKDKGDDDLLDIFEDETEHEDDGSDKSDDKGGTDGSDKGDKKDEEEPPKDEKPKDKLKRLEKVVDKKAKATRSAYLDWIMSIKVEEKAKEKFDEISKICDKESSEKNVTSDKNIIKYNEAEKRWNEAKDKITNGQNKYNESVDKLDEAIDAYVEAKRESYPRLDVAAEKEALWDKCNISGPTVKEALATWHDEKVKPNLKKWSKSFGKFVVDSVKDLYSKGTKLADDFKESAKKRRLARAEEKSKDTFAEKALENFVKKNISPILKDETITPTFKDEEKPLSIDDISRLDEDGSKENIDKNKNLIKTIDKNKNLIKTEEYIKKNSEQLLANKQDELKNRLLELKTLTIEKDHLIVEQSTTEADKVAEINAKITAKNTEISTKVSEINALKEEIKNYANNVSMNTARLKAFEAQLKAVEQELNNRKKEARDAGKDPAKATKKEVDEFVDKYKDDRIGIVIDIIAKNNTDLRKALHEDVKKNIHFANSEAFKKLSADDQKNLKNASVTGQYTVNLKPRQVSNSEEFNAKSPKEQIEACQADYKTASDELALLENDLRDLSLKIKLAQEEYEARLHDYAMKKGFENVSSLEGEIISLACNRTKLKDEESCVKTGVNNLEKEIKFLQNKVFELSLKAVKEENHPIFENKDETKTPVSKEDIVLGFEGIQENKGNVKGKGKNPAPNQSAFEGTYKSFVGSFNAFVKAAQELDSASKKTDVDKIKNDANSSFGNMKTALERLEKDRRLANHPCKESLKQLFEKLLEFAKELQRVLDTKTKGTKTASVKDKVAEVGLDATGKGKGKGKEEQATKLTGDLETDLKQMIEAGKS